MVEITRFDEIQGSRGFVNYARYLSSKHGHDPQAVAKAPDRVADILALAQRSIATSAPGRQQILPRPAILGTVRVLGQLFADAQPLAAGMDADDVTCTARGDKPEPLMERFAEIIDHRNFIYTQHLKLPIEF